MSKQKEIINKQELLEKDEHKPWYKSPLKYIVAIFLIFLVVLWIVPIYGVKQNPEPQKIPTLNELNIQIKNIPNITSNDIRDYIQTSSEIKQIADRIIALSCLDTHKVCNAKALFYFVQKNFNYVNDPLAFEYFKTPQESFSSNTGDCDDSSIFLSSLLRSVGFNTRFVKVPSHIFVQVKIPEAISSYKTGDGWINLDSTCKGCKFGEIHYSYSNSNKIFLN